MIFVTVGFHDQPFTRLIAKMDEIAGRTGEEVIIQKGCTEFKTTYATSFDFLPSDEEYMELFKKARVIVSHAGAGTVLNSLVHGKRTILVPRLRRYGEHVNDHQIELSDALKDRRLITVIQEVDQLERLLMESEDDSIANVELDDALSRYVKKRMKELAH
jgi:beta-1,4-N-acetylglucosaminyltransferase